MAAAISGATPASGTSITNNRLALQATLSGGSLTSSATTRVNDQQLTASRISYSNFAFSVAGTPYQAQGSLALVYNGINGGLANGNGEITLFSSSVKVGRLYVANGGLQIEVNGRVQPFGAVRARATR